MPACGGGVGRRRGKGRRGRESNTPSFWLLVAALKKFVVSNCACVFVCVWGGGVHAKGLGGAGRGGGVEWRAVQHTSSWLLVAALKKFVVSECVLQTVSMPFEWPVFGGGGRGGPKGWPE